MTDFAKAQLLKYGWTEGKGLGKNESGITEALRPKLKFDSAGIGHKDKDWNEWWATGYNNATNNIVVKSQLHGVSICVSKESKNESYEKNLTEKKLSYGNFLKTSTLLDGNLVQENDSNVLEVKEPEKDVMHIPLTDEELFKICGGRTAHKGARHGLKLNGKLRRIEEQEKDFLQTHNKSEKDKYDRDEENLLVSLSFFKEESAPKVSKDTKRKNKRKINDLTHQLNILCNVNDSDESYQQSTINHKPNEESKPKKKRKNKEKKSSISCDVKRIKKEEENKEIHDTSFSVRQKLDTDKAKDRIGEQINDYEGKVYDNDPTHKKKKKKKRNKEYRKNILNIQEEGECTSQTKRENINILHPTSNNTSVNCGHIINSYVRPDSPDTHWKREANRLNSKIMKKKKAKFFKKQKIKLEKITESLEAVHVSAKDSSEKNTKFP
ncbi:PREDICTED: G patch domain-containing protein 4 [Dufourea novaeangliae]|uniref:G patch domain-containing protein 4 n=1 Tax=Dufourea novaeangliae TaxID=178035 RepID=UPI0007675D7B|nr:PREDICTED: G patch domain-containing protein 4 [Dufourea novaeangliae]